MFIVSSESDFFLSRWLKYTSVALAKYFCFTHSWLVFVWVDVDELE